MPVKPIHAPPPGTFIRSGPTLNNTIEQVRKSASLTSSWPIGLNRAADGYHLYYQKLPEFWVVIYKLQSGSSGTNGRTSAFPAGTPAWAYDGYKLFVDKNLVVQQESRLYFDRYKFPLIEITENPTIPNGAVAYAVPAGDGSHYEFIWTGESMNQPTSGVCDVKIDQFFQRTGSECGYRNGCLSIVDSAGRPTGFHLKLTLDPVS